MDELLAIPGTRRESCSQAALAKLRAGELDDEAAARTRSHLSSCALCLREMDRLEQEEQQFRKEVSLAGFRRRQERKQAAHARRRWAGPAGLAIAASLLGVLALGPLRDLLKPTPRNQLKGTSPALELYVGGAGARPRVAVPDEQLSPGEKIRVAIRAPSASDGYVVVISVDEAGEATALYPETGESLPSDPGAGSHLLPDSVELTGQGFEKVIAVFSARPLRVDQVLEAARAELSRAGSLRAMSPLPVGSTESSQLLRKP